MIPVASFTEDKCSVCEEKVLLKYRDSATGAKVGQCCLHFLLTADKALAGCKTIRHPTVLDHRFKR